MRPFMKPGDSFIRDGVKLFAAPEYSLGRSTPNSWRCNGCFFEERSDCATAPKCDGLIFVTEPEWVAIKLTGGVKL